MAFIETEARYENTIMREIRNIKGELKGYDIAPMNDYVLHNFALDTYEYNPETQEFGELISIGYSPSSCSVKPEYDFDVNPSKIYAKKRDELEDDEIVY